MFALKDSQGSCCQAHGLISAALSEQRSSELGGVLREFTWRMGHTRLESSCAAPCLRQQAKRGQLELLACS